MYWTPFPEYSLEKNVGDFAILALREDEHFPPLLSHESAHLKIEISILSPPRPITFNTIRLRIHGLIIMEGDQKGLILPQIAVEEGWDVKTFLEKGCLKAALPKNAWETGATIYGFRSQIFMEN